MIVDHIRLGGFRDLPGAAWTEPRVTWEVRDTAAAHLDEVTVEIASDATFGDVIYTYRDPAPEPCGVTLDFTPAPRTVYYLRVTVKADGKDATSDPFCFESGKMQEPFCAEWISTAAGDHCHPVFRKKIKPRGKVVRARAYVCALGVYELYLDGQKVGDELLAPYFNDYRYALQVSTYPLALTDEREQELQILVGRGWYSGRFGLDGGRENIWGDRPAAIAEVHLDYADGTHEVIPTDAGWVYTPSDIEDSGIYDGEVLNRLLYAGRERPTREVEVLPDGGALQKAHLCDRYSPALGVREYLPVQRVLHTPAGETVLDMGQNFAGFMEFTAQLPRATRVTLDHGEILQDGNFYNDNYRTARAQFVYVSGGERETVRAHFTYFGFRYVRVSGWENPDPDAFRGCVVYSDMDATGELTTGNAKINRLLSNCLWGMRSNFLDMPTDCPQRDERLGWTGDAQTFAPTACYLMDTRAFYEKYCRDLRAEQQTMHGGVPNYIPSFGTLAGVSSVWGDVATFLPETLYRQYGDRAALARHYPMMRDWVDYITLEDEAHGCCHLYNTGFQFGDWLALDGITPQSMKGGTDDYYIASMYYCHSTGLLAQAAEVLGYKKDAMRYSTLREKIRRAIFKEYFTPTGRLAVDTQTAYVVALRFGIYPDREKLLDQFRERLRKDRYRIKGGFVGAPRLCTTLAEAGMVGRAYDFLLQEEYPSWLYCVNLGATTIWERWNSVLPDGKISGTGMNSLNHYSYGSVVEFLYAYAAGIRPLAPGFTRARIEPCPDVRLGHVDARYRSVSGTYACAWEICENGELRVSIEIPFGCTAEVVLPGRGGRVSSLRSGTYRYTYLPDHDYRLLYTQDTALDVLARDPRAMAILFEKAPAFGGMAAGDDAEKASVTLAQLPSMYYIPHDPALLDEAIKEICALRYEAPRGKEETI
jgi:alpha-L-rhamnosidase